MKNLFKKAIFGIALVGVFGGSLVSCSPKEMIDYTANETVKLKLDYKNHDFFKDGIGQFKVNTYIDGDTTHFKQVDTTKSQELLKSRYYGIDTPESTGAIEEYGKAASNFTKSKLQAANENGTIVVSSPSDAYGLPQPDSTGTRYLSLVWINETVKDADYTDLKLLNLYIVQEGLSYVKAVDKIPEYSDIFIAAESQAKEFKLNLFSGEKDPLFNYGSYQDVSLLELKNELQKNLEDSSYENKFNGAKVRIRGTVAGLANGTLYLQMYFDEDSGSLVKGGEYAGINVYTGMSGIANKYTTINNVIEICGTAANSENFGFQISGVNFQRTSPKEENDSKVLYYAEPVEGSTQEKTPDEYLVHEFEVTDESSLNKDYAKLFSPVHVTNNVHCYGGFKSDSNSNYTLYLGQDRATALPFSIFVACSFYPDPVNKPNTIYESIDDFIGKDFNVKGVYTFHQSTSGNISFQIAVRDTYDLTLVA